MSFESDMAKLLDEIKENTIEDAKANVEGNAFMVECPYCNKEFEAYKGKNICPHCKETVEVNLKFDF